MKNKRSLLIITMLLTALLLPVVAINIERPLEVNALPGEESKTTNKSENQDTKESEKVSEEPAASEEESIGAEESAGQEEATQDEVKETEAQEESEEPQEKASDKLKGVKYQLVQEDLAAANITPAYIAELMKRNCARADDLAINEADFAKSAALSKQILIRRNNLLNVLETRKDLKLENNEFTIEIASAWQLDELICLHLLSSESLIYEDGSEEVFNGDYLLNLIKEEEGYKIYALLSNDSAYAAMGLKDLYDFLVSDFDKVGEPVDINAAIAAEIAGKLVPEDQLIKLTEEDIAAIDQTMLKDLIENYISSRGPRKDPGESKYFAKDNAEKQPLFHKLLKARNKFIDLQNEAFDIQSKGIDVEIEEIEGWRKADKIYLRVESLESLKGDESPGGQYRNDNYIYMIKEGDKLVVQSFIVADLSMENLLPEGFIDKLRADFSKHFVDIEVENIEGFKESSIDEVIDDLIDKFKFFLESLKSFKSAENIDSEIVETSAAGDETAESEVPEAEDSEVTAASETREAVTSETTETVTSESTAD